MQTFLTIMQQYGVGSLALVATLYLGYLLDRHVRADKALHERIINNQEALEKRIFEGDESVVGRIEKVRSEGETRWNEASEKRGKIHTDVGVVSDRVSNIEGQLSVLEKLELSTKK